MAGKLTARQALFVSEYVRLGNGQKAAEAAGYSPKSARIQAAKLLTKPNVKAALQAQQNRVQSAATVDAVWLLGELVSAAQVDILDLFDERGDVRPMSEMTPEARKLISGFEVKAEYDKEGNLTGYTRRVRLTDRTKVLELIGKHKAIDAWRPTVHVVMPTLVIHDYTGVAPKDVATRVESELEAIRDGAEEAGGEEHTQRKLDG